MTEDRRDLYAGLSPRAYEGWQLFARAQGGTVTSWLEAIGQELADAAEPLDIFRRELRRPLTDKAWEVAAERRRRSPS